MQDTSESVHISSLVVQCQPNKMNAAINYAKSIEGVDVVANDVSGKLVLVLETENEKYILSIIDQLLAFNGVITATMVYHQLDC